MLGKLLLGNGCKRLSQDCVVMLEVQKRAVELMMEIINPKNPEDKSTDVASVVRSQTLEQDTQGITTDKQGFLGERPEPMGKEEIEGLTDEKITPKRLRRRIQTALMFLRVGKSLRAGSRQIWDKYHNNRL
ncbi:hypothetical protein PG984_012842 [Apiospora sp. TS-2023a]